MQLRKLQILKQQGKVSQLHRRDERSLIVDAITAARPDTKTAAYVCLLSRISPLASIASPLYRRNMTCITAPPVDDCKAYRFLHSVKGQQQQKLPSAVHSSHYRKTGTPGSNGSATKWVHNSSRLALFFSCGAWLNHGFGDIKHLTYDEKVKVHANQIMSCMVVETKSYVHDNMPPNTGCANQIILCNVMSFHMSKSCQQISYHVSYMLLKLC